MGWFSRKKKVKAEPEPPRVDPPPQPAAAEPPASAGAGEVAAITGRWEATIADIASRLDQVLAQATTESEALLGSLGTDFGPLDRIWSPAKARMHEHTEMVSDAWDAISDELSEVDGLPEGVMSREGGKRDLATCELEIRYERAYRTVMARAAEAMIAAAERGQVDADVARRMILASGGLFLGQREAQEAWEAMRRAETRINNYREKRAVPLELLKELESSARTYWTTALGVEARHAPEQQPYVAAKIESYMKDVGKTLRRYWQWREQAG
jgi:hypothetical protein